MSEAEGGEEKCNKQNQGPGPRNHAPFSDSSGQQDPHKVGRKLLASCSSKPAPWGCGLCSPGPTRGGVASLYLCPTNSARPSEGRNTSHLVPIGTT